jgi:outer membrane protein TolC
MVLSDLMEKSEMHRLTTVLRLVIFCALVTALALPGLSQQSVAQQTAQPAAPAKAAALDYSKPSSHFPNPFAPYIPHLVPEPNLSNTSRMDLLMQNGKLMLSMNDAIALALENNLDIAIARYNLDIADTDLLRAKSGGSTRGVNTGVVQNTPGGGAGSIGGGSGAGGTSTGTGGAGSGASGIVTSTSGVGSAISSFDPIVTGTLQIERATFLNNFSVFSGAKSSQNTTIGNFGYQQGFQTGTNLSFSFDNNRTTVTNNSSSYSPALSPTYRVTLSQHLLQGFGFLPNRRFIITAKNNRKISDVAFRLQVITTVNQIQNIYWDLVNAYEDVKVKERSVQLAEKTLSDNKKQVEIGTLAPIEIVRAQSDASTRQQDLIVSQTNLQLEQLLMKNAISRSLTDTHLADAEVVPVDTMEVPDKDTTGATEDLVKAALTNRAELAESRIDLTNRDITNKAAKNALLPSLDLYGFYGGSALGGKQNPLCVPSVIDPITKKVLVQGFCNTPIPTKGFGDTLSDLFSSTAPDRGAGVQLTIPLRNRAAQADQIRSQLEYRQAEMRLNQLENQVRIEVRNALFTVQQDRARVDAAKAGVELAKQSLDAETKKYALGASTNTLVLQTQRDLTQSATNLVASMAAYEKARVELDRVTGKTLDNLGIELSDAVKGQVTKMPSVPGTIKLDPVVQRYENMAPPPATTPQPQAPPQ